MSVLFTKNADLLSGFESGTWEWLVAKAGYTPDADNDEFVSDVTSEMSGSGYSRQTATSKTRTPGTGEVVYAADNPSFGSVVAGETGTWLILFKFVTTNADSPIVLALSMSKATTGTAYTVTLDPSGFAALAQG